MKSDIPPVTGEPALRSFLFRGQGSTAFGIFFKGLVLTVATLGLYWPWAMTERRRYFWGNTEFEGSRFRFNGQGADLFKGVVLVSLGYGLVGTLVAQLVRWVSPVAGGVALGALAAAYVFYLAPRLLLGSAKYRASRSEWRGIRFCLNARFSDFYPVYLKGLFWTLLTLGLYAPIFVEDIFRFGIERLSLGTSRFAYSGDRLEYALSWYLHFFVLTGITFGLYGPWARAAMFRLRVSRVRFKGGQLQSGVSGGSYWLFAVRGVLAVFTLFLLVPANAVFKLRTLVESLSLKDAQGLDSIQQVEGKAGSFDEAGTLLFGYDLGLDFG